MQAGQQAICCEDSLTFVSEKGYHQGEPPVEQDTGGARRNNRPECSALHECLLCVSLAHLSSNQVTYDSQTEGTALFVNVTSLRLPLVLPGWTRQALVAGNLGRTQRSRTLA